MNSIIWLSFGVFSLVIGSFLALIVYRLPLMLHCWNQEERSMRKETCFPQSFNLLVPASHCPRCKHALRFWEKLPMLGYMLAKGKCAYCKQKIHLRYITIEIMTVICSCVIFLHFRPNMQMLAVLVFTWGLILLSGIDLEQHLLPDIIILPLLWFGLILNAFGTFVSATSAILGATIAYIGLWTLAKIYNFFAKKEGMGYGDFKCFAMLGAWLGVDLLAYILLCASLLGLIGGSLLLKKEDFLQSSIPFGPYLALSGWLMLLIFK
jgi:leader peptidase (prepilin peptidase) / N-methyltransferase